MNLDREEFREWLEARDPREVVGIRADNCHCPIATFLRSSGDHPYATVAYHSYSLEGPTSDRASTPRWARLFIGMVDDDSNPYDITAGLALAVLERIGE